MKDIIKKILREQISTELEQDLNAFHPDLFELEEGKKKKKKKKKAKRDACYHKVKSRYKVWPSAYASGALVKCRKVGAKNWGNSTKEGVKLDEGMYGMSEPLDYVVVDMRNLRPLMMNYGDGQYYEKWQTELDAQKSADDLNRAYQKTYGAVEGPHVVMYKSDYFTEKRTQEELNSEEELDEVTGASSSGSFEGPAIWAKNKKNWRAVNDPNFPKYGGPGSTFVKVKKKCSRFPYCNQGDINALEFYEDKKLNEAITSVSKKTGKSISYLKNIIIKELEDSATAKKLRKQAKDRVRKYTKKEIEEIIRRPFYKSPITNLVGNAKMDLPIGKLYTMKGNKPKYEG